MNKISIVTVTFNCDSVIEATIKSVISQTYPNYEYIIIDGKSHDNTLNIIDKYKARIDKLISEPDKGIYDAMNKAINMSTGDWIIFMNAGDVFYSVDAIEKIMSQYDGSADVIYGNSIRRQLGHTINDIASDDVRGLDYAPIYRHGSSLVRTQIHKENLFDLSLKKKYGKDFPRNTEITSFETITATKVVNNNAKLYANYEAGFVGMGLKKDDNGVLVGECSDLSEIIVIGRNGKYRVSKVSDKAFFGKDLLYVGVFNRNDERTIYNVIYRDGKDSVYYAKRFAITSVTRDKEYDITPGKEGTVVMWFSANHNGEAEVVKINFRPRAKLKKSSIEYDFSALAVKGKASRGNLVTRFPVQKMMLKTKGVSTIGGKDIWYDADVQRLNEDGRGMLLGEFSGNDKIIAVFKNGTYYTTSYDLSNRYQGDLLLIEKYDENKVYAALYYDGENFYIKRFSFPPSDNSPASFIADNRGAYLADFSADKHPQFMVTFTGRQEHREPEKFDAEEFIAKKGITAKGNRCHRYDILKVEFIEPLHKPEDDEEEGAKPGEIISLGPEDIPDDETFSPESMYQPTGEGEETHGDLGEPDPDSDDADEPNLFDL